MKRSWVLPALLCAVTLPGPAAALPASSPGSTDGVIFLPTGAAAFDTIFVSVRPAGCNDSIVVAIVNYPDGTYTMAPASAQVGNCPADLKWVASSGKGTIAGAYSYQNIDGGTSLLVYGSDATGAIVNVYTDSGPTLTFKAPLTDSPDVIAQLVFVRAAQIFGVSTKSAGATSATAPIALLAVGNNASFTVTNSAVYLFDPATATLVQGFGTKGRAFTTGNFLGRWIVTTPTGVVIGGQSKVVDPTRPGIGVANFDLNGVRGTCGATVKEVLPRTNQFVLPDTTGGFYDAASGLVTFVGQANGTQFFGRQLLPDCTLNSTQMTYQGSVLAGPMTAVTNGVLAVAVNDFLGGKSAARVALYPTTSGSAPTAVSSVLASPVAGGPTPTSTVGMIAVQADAKIIMAGSSDALGGSVFSARFVGVETTTPVVEFYNVDLGHYFVTADPNEAKAIDAGSAGPGWSRTGQTWKSGGPDRVCRFYGVQTAGGPNGHFYTIDSAECAAVQRDPGWHFESYDYSGWRRSADGSCPSGTNPVKRAYNGRFAQHDSNHRYATSDAIYNQMLALGWSGEGIVFCAVQ